MDYRRPAESAKDDFRPVRRLCRSRCYGDLVGMPVRGVHDEHPGVRVDVPVWTAGTSHVNETLDRVVLAAAPRHVGVFGQGGSKAAEVEVVVASALVEVAVVCGVVVVDWMS